MRFLAFLLFLAFLIFAVFARWFFICDILQLCDDDTTEEVEDVRLKNLQLTKEDTIILSGYDQFLFAPESYTPELNENNRAFLDTLAQLMATDSSVDLQIIGLFRELESDVMAGFYEDLGFARAAAVQDLLLTKGVGENHIILKSQVSTDSLIGEPLAFSFVSNQLPSEFANASYLFTNMTYSDANFPSNSDVFDPGDAFRTYADSVKTYIDLNPDKSIRIIGHTDNVDTDRYNMKLGLRRAKSAKSWLLDHGIECEIDVESMGETKPVATNKTAEGRQLNRRVNFIIE